MRVFTFNVQQFTNYSQMLRLSGSISFLVQFSWAKLNELSDFTKTSINMDRRV